MKKLANSKKILLSVLLMCAFSSAFIGTARAYVYLHPWSYNVIEGTVVGGSIYSVLGNDGNTLDIKASHFWFFRFFYHIEIDLLMEHHKYNYAVVDFTDNIGDTITVRVYYTDGSSEIAGYVTDGLHMLPINPTMYLDKIKLSWGGSSYAWEYIAYYIYINWIAATPI